MTIVNCEWGASHRGRASSPPIDAAPAVAGELVLAATRAGEFLAFDRASGALRWRVRSGAELPLAWEGMSGDLYTASPAVSGDLAVFGGPTNAPTGTHPATSTQPIG